MRSRNYIPHVYFLRALSGAGPIKIGSSIDPEGRLKTYMSWSPEPLGILATLPGPKDLERRFHAAFATDQLHHEWFRPTLPLLAAIRAISEDRFDTATLPAPAGLATARNTWSEQTKTGIATKGVASRAAWLWGVELGPVTRDAYDRIAGLDGEDWRAAYNTLRAFIANPAGLGIAVNHEYAAAWREKMLARAA